MAFILYVLALTTGTHWPKLEMTVAGERAPDKIIHMLAFGGLLFLLWRTRWLGDGFLLLAVGLVWALVDELTQAIPGLGRTVSWMDIAANWMGMALVFAWIRAMRPVGGPLNRLRIRMNEFVIDEIFLQWRTWLLAPLAGFAMATLVGASATLIMWQVHPDGIMFAAFIAIPVGAIGGAHVLLDRLWRNERDRVCAQRRCILCGGDCSSITFDVHGTSICPTCGSPLHHGEWPMRTDITRETAVRLAIGPALLALALSAVAFLLYLAGLALYVRWPMSFQFLRQVDRMPMDLRLVADMTIIGVIIAMAVYRFRKNLARIIDQQHERCRHCGHDVHATGAEQGIGRCPECGTVFVRLDTERASG